MIKNKNDLKEYLYADKKALNRLNRKRPKFNDLIWKYEIVLRKCEYYNNIKTNLWNKICLNYYKYKKYVLETKTCFYIPMNVCGKGLSIAHCGPIIINGKCKIGENCRIHVGTNIGANYYSADSCPTIGDNVYIAPGVKIFGKIRIASNVMIGANAVVKKDFLEENVVIAGIPAKVVKKIENGEK